MFILLNNFSVIPTSLLSFPPPFCHSRESGNPFLLSILDPRFREGDGGGRHFHLPSVIPTSLLSFPPPFCHSRESGNLSFFLNPGSPLVGGDDKKRVGGDDRKKASQKIGVKLQFSNHSVRQNLPLLRRKGIFSLLVSDINGK